MSKRFALNGSTFKFHGAVYVDGRHPKDLGTIDWSGKWTSPTTVSGTIRLRSPWTPVKGKLVRRNCDTGIQHWHGGKDFMPFGGGGG